MYQDMNVLATRTATARGRCKPVCTLDASGMLHPKTAIMRAAAAPAAHGCLCADGQLQAAPAPQFAANKHRCVPQQVVTAQSTSLRHPVGIVTHVGIVWPVHILAVDCW